MPREDVSFQTADGVTLRGWFYSPGGADEDDARTRQGPLPCLILAHGFTALKEMDLDKFAEHFVAQLPLTCLVYDNRCFGESDGQPRYEIIPALQISDYSDAITYAQMRPDVNADRIGIWGSSYSGGHVLQVGAGDRRVKVVLSQAPLVDGWETFHRLTRPDFVPGLYDAITEDRHGRAKGNPPTMVPVVDEDVHKPSALPTPDSFKFFNAWSERSSWKNEVTMKSLDLLRTHVPANFIHRISPTPLLMTVAEKDVLTPTDLALAAYAQAREPKQLQIIPDAGHFDAYTGSFFERNAGTQVEFLRKHLLR